MNKEFVKDRWSGISLGLEYKFRLVKHRNKYVIFNYLTGEIIEPIKKIKKENEFFYERRAMERLYEINRVKRELSNEIKQENRFN